MVLSHFKHTIQWLVVNVPSHANLIEFQGISTSLFPWSRFFKDCFLSGLPTSQREVVL